MAWNFSGIFGKRKTKPEQIHSPKNGFAYNSGTPVTTDTAMQVSAFHRGVIYISTQIAKLPFYVKDKENNILYNAKVTYLLNLQPNSEMTAFSFKSCLIQNTIVYGNGYAEIQRNAIGEPIALWLIPSNYVQAMRSPKGELVYRILNGTSYGQDSYIFPENMYHIKNFHTADGIIGQGVVAYALTTLGISLGADQLAGGLFANGALPSGVLSLPGNLSDEAFDRIKADWKEKYGAKKSGSIAVLEEGMTFNAISINPDVLQFLESRKFSVLEIARFLGVPPTKLFDMEGAKFANMENANLEVVTDCLDTWAKMLEQEADVKLLNGQYAGRKAEIDLYSLFRGDMATRADYFSKMMQTGSMTPNEIRNKEGLAPYADGNKFFIAINNYSPADRIDEIIDSQISKNKAPTQAASPKVDTAKSEVDEALIEFLRKK